MKLPWRPATPVVNLALQGGGAHGAFTWGVLDALLEDGRLAFEGVSGTSAGAMNAVVLAQGLMAGGRDGARQALRDFWTAVAESLPFDAAVPTVFDEYAAKLRASAVQMGGRDWHVTLQAGGFLYESGGDVFDLPLPALAGAHQMLNAGAAITALRLSPFAALARQDILSDAMRRVRWPGRLEQLQNGALAALLPAGWELWVDGAHNDSGAETLRAQIDSWAAADGLPLHLVTAFKARKTPDDFFARLAGCFDSAQAVHFGIDAPMEPPESLAALLQAAGYADVSVSESLPAALAAPRFASAPRGRIIITGSLYLVGHALKLNGA